MIENNRGLLLMEKALAMIGESASVVANADRL